jgi:alanine racemase
MTWKTRVLAVSVVDAGARVGYGGTFVAQRAMRLALLPVGYADGLRRELSGSMGKASGWVVIGGRRAMIVGRISMNLATVDVTGIDGVAAGDEVVLLGEGITAEDHAALAETIPYEILCGVRATAVPVD